MEAEPNKYTSVEYLKIFLSVVLILLCPILLKNSALAQELTIEGTPPPAIQDEPYIFTPKVYNAVGQPTFEDVNIPDWAVFNIETGEIRSKPDYPLNENVGLYEGIAIIVRDEAEGIDILSFSIEVQNINDKPQIYNIEGNPVDTLPDATENTEYSYKFTAFDPDLTIDVNEELVFGFITAPSWLSISAAMPDTKTGIIQATLKGTPGDKDPGTYPVQIQVEDKQGRRAVTNLLELTIVNVNDEPIISGIPEKEVNQGETYSFIPEYNDNDFDIAEDLRKDNISFSIKFDADRTDLPDWLSFNPETGELSSKNPPANDDVGLIENIVISISDNVPDNSIDDSLPAFNLCVKNVNDPPALSKTLEIPGDGEITTAEYEVSQVLDPATPQGQAFTMVFTASDIDLSLIEKQCNTIQDSFIFAGGSIPSWAKLIPDPENPSKARLVNIEGRPNNDDVGPWQNIEIVVKDGLTNKNGQDTRAGLVFNINVNNQNDQPSLIQVPEKNIIVNEDQALISNIIKADDIDMKYGDQLYFSLDSPEYEDKLSRWLSIKAINTTDAEITGTPKNEDVGTYSDIKLIVSDKQDETAEYTFNIEVKNTNDPPIFDMVPPNDTPIEINAGEPWPGENDQYTAIHARDDDIYYGDLVKYSIVSSPAPGWMNIELESDKVLLTGTPSNSHAGINTITLTAEDQNGAKDQYTFYVKVNYVKSIPAINRDGLPEIEPGHDYPTFIINEDEFYKHTIFVSDDDKLYGDILTYKLENAPSWLKINKDPEQNAVLSGTPCKEDIASNTGIKLTVTDKSGISDFIEFDIEVLEVNDRPVISGSLPTAVVGRDYYYAPWSYDEEENNICFRINPHLTWLNIDENTGLLTGMPFKNDIGEQTITIYAYEDETCLSASEIPFDKIFNNESQLGPVILKVIGLDVIVLPGDIDASGTIDLKDSILGLQILADIPLPISISKYSDLDGDRIIGLKEAIYILRKSAGIID